MSPSFSSSRFFSLLLQASSRVTSSFASSSLLSLFLLLLLASLFHLLLLASLAFHASPAFLTSLSSRFSRFSRFSLLLTSRFFSSSSRFFPHYVFFHFFFSFFSLLPTPPFSLLPAPLLLSCSRSFRFFPLLLLRASSHVTSFASSSLSSRFSCFSRFSLLLPSRFFSHLLLPSSASLSSRFFYCVWQSRSGNDGVVGFPHWGFPYESDWPSLGGSRFCFFFHFYAIRDQEFSSKRGDNVTRRGHGWCIAE